MRGAATRPGNDAQRTLRAARELAFSRLSIHEKLARRRETIGVSRAVGTFLFSNDEEEVDTILAGSREVVRGNQHCGRNSLRVARAAAAQLRSVELWWDVG